MKRGIDYLNIFVYLYPVFISNGKLFYFAQINLIHLRANYIKKTFLDGDWAVKFFNQRIVFYPVDAGNYSIGNLRNYLPAIGSVNFIAIVFGRVVTGGNYYTSSSVEVKYSKGKLRSRTYILK
ncbi:hypothetical protein ES708_04765 [subsurface metagenome]